MDHLSEMSRNKYDAEFNEYHSRNVIGSDVSNYRKKSCLKLWNFSVFDMVPPGAHNKLVVCGNESYICAG